MQIHFGKSNNQVLHYEKCSHSTKRHGTHVITKCRSNRNLRQAFIYYRQLYAAIVVADKNLKTQQKKYNRNRIGQQNGATKKSVHKLNIGVYFFMCFYPPNSLNSTFLPPLTIWVHNNNNVKKKSKKVTVKNLIRFSLKLNRKSTNCCRNSSNCKYQSLTSGVVMCACVRESVSVCMYVCKCYQCESELNHSFTKTYIYLHTARIYDFVVVLHMHK